MSVRIITDSASDISQETGISRYFRLRCASEKRNS